MRSPLSFASINGAYNMFASAVESANKTAASFAKASASTSWPSSASQSKEKDNELLRRKLMEPDEWKDNAGMTHVKHLNAFTSCKSMSAFVAETT